MAELASTSLFSDANLVAYYELENGALTTDSKGTFTLVNGNSVAEATGKFGGAGNWNGAGSNQYLGTGNNLGITNGSVSLVAWVNMNGTIASTDFRRFLVIVSDSGQHVSNYFDYQFNGGTPRINFERGRENVADDQTFATITLTPSTWFHLGMTYNGTSVVSYVNGSAQGTVASSGTGSSGGATVFAIGNTGTAGPVYQCDAVVDDVGVFNRALTAAEIQTLYADSATSFLDLTSKYW